MHLKVAVWVVTIVLLPAMLCAQQNEESRRMNGNRDTEMSRAGARFARLCVEGDPDDAIAAYCELSKDMREKPVFRLAHFELLIRKRRYEQAESVASMIQHQYPHSGRVLCTLAVYRIRQGSLKEGRKLLALAMEADPFYARSYYELARISSTRKQRLDLCTRGLLVAQEKQLQQDLVKLLAQTQAATE